MSPLSVLLIGMQLAGAASPPRLLNPDQVIKEYPPALMRSNTQGRVDLLLTITAEGRVKRCAVEKSSGPAELDAVSCEQFRARARYEPARSPDGTPIESTTHKEIVWAVGSGTPWPTTEWASRTALTITSGGHVKSCAKEASSPMTDMESTCGEFSRAGVPLLMVLRNDRTLANRFKGDRIVVFEIHFYPTTDTPSTLPGNQEGEELVARLRTNFEIDPDGQPKNCRMVESTGPSALRRDLCREFFDGPYVANTTSAMREAQGLLAIYIRH